MVKHDAAPWVDDIYVVRDDARRDESWGRFVARQNGLGVAVRYAMRVGDRLRAMSINTREARLSRLDALVRASVYYSNDESEVERFVRAVAE